MRINKSNSGRSERENLESLCSENNAQASILGRHGQELVTDGFSDAQSSECDLELKKDLVWILRLSN